MAQTRPYLVTCAAIMALVPMVSAGLCARSSAVLDACSSRLMEGEAGLERCCSLLQAHQLHGCLCPECETGVGLVSALGVQSLQALAPLVGACAQSSLGAQQLADILASLPLETSLPRALALQGESETAAGVWGLEPGTRLAGPSGLGAALASAMRHHDRTEGRRGAEDGRRAYSAIDLRMQGTVDLLREVLGVLRSLADPERAAGGMKVGLEAQLPRRLMLRAAHRLDDAEKELEGLRRGVGRQAPDAAPGACSCRRQAAWSWLPKGLVALRDDLCVFACSHHRLLTLALVLEGVAALCLTMYWLGAHGTVAEGEDAARRQRATEGKRGAPAGSIIRAAEHAADDCRTPLLSSS
uniref:Uncharacterized protein n=1 Tax=Auxenochlorella protothecoides TaxID=3075 RepID=A0A1D2A5J7_AUXPR